MPSLWTDDDHSAHPWIAGRPHGDAPAAAHAQDDEPGAHRFARTAVMAAACAAAAVAGALFQVLR